MPHNQKRRTNVILIYGLSLLFMWFFTGKPGWWFFKGFLVEMNVYTIFLVLILMLILGALSIGRSAGKSREQSRVLELWKKGALFIFLFFIGQEKIRQLSYTKKDKIPKTFSQDWPSQQKLFPIMERIYTETNRLPKEAMKRILLLGIHSELSLLSYYTIVRELTERNKLSNTHLKRYGISQPKPEFIYASSETPDGYMIIQHLQKFVSYSGRDWKEYLSHSSVLSDVLRREIRQSKVVLKNPKLYNRHWLIPYSVTKKSIFQKGFHNVGQPYYWEEPEWLKSCSGTGQFQNDDGLYWCLILPGYLQRAGVHIKLSDPDPEASHSFFEIAFSGPLIGTSENSTNRDGFALWSDIQIHWSCGTMKFQYDLPNIGWKFIRPYSDRAKKQAEQLTAPVTLKIPMTSRYRLSKSISQTSCKKETVRKIEMTFDHSHYSYSRMYPSKRMQVIWNK